MTLERFCPACGHPRAEPDRYCGQCGRAFQPLGAEARDTEATPPGPAAGSPPPETPSRRRGEVLPSNVDTTEAEPATWRVTQSPWLIGLLVFATLNLYAIWWLGRTWSQIKHEDGDTGKAPYWHALAMLVPIYGYFRFHAHMRAIAGLARVPIGLEPGTMTLAWAVLNVLGYFAGRPEVPFWLAMLAAALGGALFGWAQAALNATWRSLPGGAVKGHPHPLHWIILMLVTLIYIVALLGLLVGAD